jgi:hypothetical protein
MKFRYFKIKEAFDETKDSFSYGTGADKMSSTAKFLGKTVANIGMFAVSAGVEIVKRIPETIGDVSKRNLKEYSHKMTEEQIEKAEKAVEMGEEYRERRLAKKTEKEQSN